MQDSERSERPERQGDRDPQLAAFSSDVPCRSSIQLTTLRPPFGPPLLVDVPLLPTSRPSFDHRLHGPLIADATEPALNGYLFSVACPCGVVFERWITPWDAELDLLRVAELN